MNVKVINEPGYEPFEGELMGVFRSIDGGLSLLLKDADGHWETVGAENTDLPAEVSELFRR